MDVHVLSDLASKILEPEECVEEGIMYGRFNPPSNNHIHAMDRAVDRHSLEKLNLYVVDSPASSNNPMTYEHIEQSFQGVVEQRQMDYDIDVNKHEINTFGSISWEDIDIPEDCVYYTADIQHGFLGVLRDKLSQSGLEVDYEPRYEQDFHELDNVPESGSQVRELINEEGSWERYVPDATAKIIHNNPDVVENINKDDEMSPGKHLEIVKSILE
jgi:hypothetical protein